MIAATDIDVLPRFHKIQAEVKEVLGRYANVVLVPRVLWHGRKYASELSVTGMNVGQNLQKFRVRVSMTNPVH